MSREKKLYIKDLAEEEVETSLGKMRVRHLAVSDAAEAVSQNRDRHEVGRELIKAIVRRLGTEEKLTDAEIDKLSEEDVAKLALFIRDDYDRNKADTALAALAADLFTSISLKLTGIGAKHSFSTPLISKKTKLSVLNAMEAVKESTENFRKSYLSSIESRQKLEETNQRVSEAFRRNISRYESRDTLPGPVPQDPQRRVADATEGTLQLLADLVKQSKEQSKNWDHVGIIAVNLAELSTSVTKGLGEYVENLDAQKVAASEQLKGASLSLRIAVIALAVSAGLTIFQICMDMSAGEDEERYQKRVYDQMIQQSTLLKEIGDHTGTPAIVLTPLDFKLDTTEIKYAN